MAASGTLYGLTETAALLETSQLRVRNLSTVAVYGLQFTGVWVGGKGTGARRLFGWRDVQRLAVANCLFEFGFAPDAIGDALARIRDRYLTGDWTLLREYPGWAVAAAGAVPFDAAVYFVLRLPPLFAELEARREAAKKGTSE